LALKVDLRIPGDSTQYELHPKCSVPRGKITENQVLEITVFLNGEPVQPDLELLINDIPTPRLSRRGRALFLFETDFFAGDLRVAVVQNRKVVAATEVVIDPEKTKLTREEYGSLVDEISRQTQALYRMGRVTMPTKAGLSARRNYILTLELIRVNFDNFERAVTRISSQPLRSLATTTRKASAHQIQRIDSEAINQAIRSKTTRMATKAEVLRVPNLVKALGGRWSPTFVEKRRHETLSVYENRAILGFVRWLRSTLATLSARISSEVDLPQYAVNIWEDRITKWRHRLTTLEKGNLFSDLVPTSALHATSVFRMHPDYSTAFSAMMRIRSGFAPGATEVPAMPIDKTYKLYELWCYIGILVAAAERYPDSREQIMQVLEGLDGSRTLGTVLLSGELGSISLRDGLSITYQKRISPQASPDGLRTGLVEAIPDISLVRCNESGRCEALTVLDPKYRAGRSLNQGIKDLHAYRDAILDREGSRVVRAAVVLAPRAQGFPDSTGPWPSNEPVVVSARPKHDPELFENLLEKGLNSLVVSDGALASALVNASE